MDEPCTLPLSPPKGGTKRYFAVLPVNFIFCRPKSATKFFCVKTSRGIAVATSFLYLAAHRWIAGEVPVCLKFAFKVTHFFRKRRFRQISLNSASVVKASEKGTIITNKKSTMRFPSSHRWTLCVTPKFPKGWLKWFFYIFLRCLLYLRCR